MKYSFYDPSTGLFAPRTFSGSAKLLSVNTPEGLRPIEGAYDRRTQRVDVQTGTVVAYERPATEIETEQQVARARRARQRIERLELAQHRPLRELAVDPNNVEAKRRLAEIDGEIAALRESLAH